jgi:hypothetical protein
VRQFRILVQLQIWFRHGQIQKHIWTHQQICARRLFASIRAYSSPGTTTNSDESAFIFVATTSPPVAKFILFSFLVLILFSVASFDF